jgi:hypothetical protein
LHQARTSALALLPASPAIRRSPTGQSRLTLLQLDSAYHMGAHASLHGPLVSLFLPLSRVTRPSHRHDSTAATLLTQLPRCIVMHLSSIARAPCAMCFSLSPAACAELFPFKSRLPLPTCIFCVPSYFSEKAPPGAPSSTAAPFSLVSSTGDRVYAPNFIESPPPPPFLR